MEMPYVRTLHNFRLLNENAMLKRAGIEDNQIGGLTEVYFGLFTDPEDGCRPRLRVKAIQEMTGWKASHAFELPAVFCNRDHGFSHFVFDGEPEEVFHKIAAEIHGRWVNFTKTGVPTLPEGAGSESAGSLDAEPVAACDWPRFEGADSPVMIFNRESKAERLDRRHLMETWGDMRFYENRCDLFKAHSQNPARNQISAG